MYLVNYPYAVLKHMLSTETIELVLNNCNSLSRYINPTTIEYRPQNTSQITDKISYIIQYEVSRKLNLTRYETHC